MIAIFQRYPVAFKQCLLLGSTKSLPKLENYAPNTGLRDNQSLCPKFMRKKLLVQQLPTLDLIWSSLFGLKIIYIQTFVLL